MSSGPGAYPMDGLGTGGDAWGTQIKGLSRPNYRYDRLPKEAYRYRPATSGERCSTCQNSQFPPGSKTGVCVVVLGPIEADYVCDAFSGFATVSSKDTVRTLPYESLVRLSKRTESDQDRGC